MAEIHHIDHGDSAGMTAMAMVVLLIAVAAIAGLLFYAFNGKLPTQNANPGNTINIEGTLQNPSDGQQ